MNRFITTVIIVAIIVVGAVLVFGETNVSPQSQSGTVYFGVENTTTDIEGISSAEMDIDQVSLYSEQSGWVPAQFQKASFDLLKNNNGNSIQVVGTATTSDAVYNQIRLIISDVNIRERNEEGGTSMADVELTTHKVILPTNISLSDQATSTITLNIDMNESLEKKEGGGYIFNPSISATGRTNAVIEFLQNGLMNITNGEVVTE